MNKLVKRVIGTVLSERRAAGQNPNWTEILGSVAAVINSQCGRGKNDVSAYEAVFGQKLDHPLSSSKSEARRCWTVKDRMLVTHEPEFNTYCKEHYITEDDINEVTDHDDSDFGYFSEDDLPLSEMDEVSDEYFDSHLLDDTDGVDDRKSPPELPPFPERRLTETVPGDMCLLCPPTPDDNGLMFGPSCTGRCFTTDDECDHDKVKVQLNEVGQYAVFPSLWWHHGYYDIKDEEKVIFTAQLFATPSSDIGSSKRSNRRNSQMNTYSHGQLSTLNGLGEDLFLEWDRKYSAHEFPPASKFLGRVDKAKNRHILKHQIHLLPKIERLVLAFEEKFRDITVDSVWLIKKTKQDDGFQEWHQDMKTKITTTIVVNVGSGVKEDKMSIVSKEVKNNMVSKANPDYVDRSPVLRKNASLKKYYFSVQDG